MRSGAIDSLQIVTVGPISVGIQLSSGRLEAAAARRFAGFLSDEKPDLVIKLQEGAAQPDSIPIEIQSVERRGSLLKMQADFASLDLDFDSCLGCATVITGSDAQLRNAIDNLMRFLVSQLLLERRAVLLHAAGVAIEDGGAILFVGPNGAGKSTIARLSLESGYGILGDDLIVVEPETRTCYATPFMGELQIIGAVQVATIRSIFLIEQAGQHQVLPIASAEAVGALVAQAQPLGFVDRGRIPDLIGWVSPLAPICRRLRFRKDSGFWEVILSSSANTAK